MLISALNQSYTTNQINRSDMNQNMVDKAKENSEKKKPMMREDEQKPEQAEYAKSARATQQPQKGSAYSPSKPNMMSKPSAVMSTVDQIV